MDGAIGYIYPNEYWVPWTVLIALYPHLTSMMAGSFLVAAANKVGGIEAFAPVRRIALLATLAFAAAAPLPLLLHLHHPDRALTIMVTPNLNSAMAVFGFALAFFVLAVVLWVIWLEYRSDLVSWAESATGPRRMLFRALLLGVSDASDAARATDEKLSRVLYLIGIPSALLLPGYVGFIFGSIKANAWWQSPLIPVVFIALAFVSGFELVMLLYVLGNKFRGKHGDPETERRLGLYLLVSILVAFSLTGLDTIHHFYLRMESFGIVDAAVHDRLWFSMITMQILVGAVVPAVMLTALFFYRIRGTWEWVLHVIVALLVQAGVFAVRWNVVMGGQSFSRSLRGYRPTNFEWVGREGGLTALAVLAVPFAILTVLALILPPFLDGRVGGSTDRRPLGPVLLGPLLLILPLAPFAYGLTADEGSGVQLGEPAAAIEVDSDLPGTFRPEAREVTVLRDPPLEPEPVVEPAAADGTGEGSGGAEGSAGSDAETDSEGSSN